MRDAVLMENVMSRSGNGLRVAEPDASHFSPEIGAMLEAARKSLMADAAVVLERSGDELAVLFGLDPDDRFDDADLMEDSLDLGRAAIDRERNKLEPDDASMGRAIALRVGGEVWGALCFLFADDGPGRETAADMATLELIRLGAEAVLERDIERKRHAAEEAEAAAMMNNVPARLWIKDEENRIRGVNTAGLEWAGVSRSEVIGRKVEDVFTGDLLRSHQLDLDVLKSGKARRGSIEQYDLGNGDIRWAKVDIVPLENPVSAERGVFTFATDVTEQMHAERKLRQINTELAAEREKFSRLYRETPVLMHSVNERGEIVEVSNMWLQRFGYERSEVIGRKSTDFLTEESARAAREETIPEFFRTGACWDVPYEIVCRDGSIVEVELSAILDGDSPSGKRSFAVITDVSQRNRALKTLEDRNDELERANESLRQFAYVASHDLQEPLRKMQAFTDVLRDAVREGNDEERDYALRALSDAAIRSRKLVSDLLQYSRASNQKLDIVPVPMAPLVDEVLVSLSSSIEESGAEISVDLVDRPIQADRSQLFQTVLNLLSNALKYRHPDRTPQISVAMSGAADGSSVTLRVRDNGIGFDPAFANQIFEPFKRLHNNSEYPGTGIGLAICETVATRHGWTFDVSPEPGKGSTFGLTIPLDG